MSYFDCSLDNGGYIEYKVEIQKELEDQCMRRGTITSIDSVPQGASYVSGKEERKQKDGYK